MRVKYGFLKFLKTKIDMNLIRHGRLVGRR